MLLRRSGTYTDERRLTMKSPIASKYDNNNSAQGHANNDKLCSDFKQYMSTRRQTVQTYEQGTPTWMQCKKKAALITALTIIALSILCLSVITISSVCSSRKTAGESNDPPSQYTDFDPINDIGPKTNKSKTMTNGFDIDNTGSGDSPAVIITTKCSVQAIEITEDGQNLVTITSYANELADLIGAQSLILDCTPRVDNDTAPPPPDVGSEAIAEFGWPQGSNPPLGSIKATSS